MHGNVVLNDILCNCFSSDKPGNHNFDLLKKLILPDGSVLRAQLPGRPTRDCLFADPARDGTRFSFFSIISFQAWPQFHEKNLLRLLFLQFAQGMEREQVLRCHRCF